jgi:transcriptional regulator GlxA family with amidase domain
MSGLPLRTEARMERAVMFMREHLAEKLAVDDLARVSGLSPGRFTRLFGQWTGYSPKDYLRRLRVGLARELLADAELPIKEIAARTGFDDPYHFSKVFHQLDGLSPTQYREAFLAAAKVRAAAPLPGAKRPA